MSPRSLSIVAIGNIVIDIAWKGDILSMIWHAQLSQASPENGFWRRSVESNPLFKRRSRSHTNVAGAQRAVAHVKVRSMKQRS